MKNIIRLITIIVIIAIRFSSYGQLKRANQYFDLYRYAKAIPLYQKVINKGSEVKRNEAIVKIADCYRLINNPQEARSWYARAVENQATAPVNYLYLGQAWCELENYADAKTAFEKYSQLAPDDTKGSLYAGFCDWANENKNTVSSATEIKNEEALNTKWSDFSPVVYKDGIVFTSDRVSDTKTDLTYKWTDNDYLDLYVSKPKYYKDFWSDMTIPKNLNNGYEQTYHDGPAVFSKDGSMVVISRTDRKNVKESKGKVKTHVVKMFYADVVSGKEPKFIPFFLNSDDYSVAHPTLSPDAKTMIFSSDKPGGSGESDLYMCKWENDAWASAVNLGEKINTIGNEVFPTLVNDTILLFASDGHAGFGGLDIFISYKKGDEWSEPKNLMKPINSSYDDFGILMFNDLKSGYFSSNRPEGVGLDDIYAFRNLGATISEKIKTSEKVKASEKEIAISEKEVATVVDTANMSIITGLVKDKTTQQPIAGATVFLLNPQNSKVKIMKTNADGQYKTTVDRPAEYLVKAMQKNNIADCLPWDIAAIEAGKTMTAPRDLLLDKLDVNKSFVLKNIYYDRDKSDIREDAKPDLNKVIKIMQENPNIIAEIASHTDSRASFEYNNALSQNRANAAVDYIVMNGGILPGRILARGYGEYKLTNRCKDDVPCTEAEHQMNRRTEFKVIAVSQPSGRGQFDPSKFTEGEIISSKNLPDFFFEPCQLKISDSPAEVAATQQPAATPVNQTATPVKQTTTAVTQTATPQNETTSATVPAYHIVVLGETLYHISITNNITVEKLKELNNLSNNTIIVGQKLRLN